MFANRVLLITGGTGTFGNAVLNRVLHTDIAEIRIFSRDEKKQHDMRLGYNNRKLKFYIGDVRRPESLLDAMVGVDFVFHAAALKQVPSCEFYPMEALLTNAVGAEKHNLHIYLCVVVRREERTEHTVYETRCEDLVVARLAFTLCEAARETACC